MVKLSKSWIVGFLSIILALCSIFFLPNIVPTHYDLAGNIDSWGSKYTNLVFPALIIVMIIVFALIQKSLNKASLSDNNVDKNEAYKKTNTRVIDIVSLLVSCLFFIIQLFVYINQIAITNKTGSLMISANSIISVSSAAFGLLLIAIGNYMPKTKRNGVIGIRTKWSMYNDNTWNKSNLFGAVVFEIIGIITIVVSFTLNKLYLLICVVSLVVVAAIIITVYSYIVFKKVLNSKQ